LSAGPPAAKCLSFVKLASIQIPHGQESRVVRPRQRKTGGDGAYLIAVSRLSRRCLDFSEVDGRFSVSRQQNVAICKVERAHLEQICPPETSPESGLKVARQAHD
jgi:hypothetical protein